MLLGEELRRLRRARGVTGQHLAAEAGFSHSKLSKIENGHNSPSEQELVRLLDLLQAPQSLARQLLDVLHREDDIVADRMQLRSLGQKELMRIEGSARSVRCYAPDLVPGLLQHAHYVADLVEHLQSAGLKMHAAEHIGYRVLRQRILYDPDREFTFVLDRGVLMNRPEHVRDARVWGLQLTHLRDLLEHHSNIHISITEVPRLPFAPEVTVFDGTSATKETLYTFEYVEDRHAVAECTSLVMTMLADVRPWTP